MDRSQHTETCCDVQLCFCDARRCNVVMPELGLLQACTAYVIPKGTRTQHEVQTLRVYHCIGSEQDNDQAVSQSLSILVTS
jgi:hypothetical protein